MIIQTYISKVHVTIGCPLRRKNCLQVSPSKSCSRSFKICTLRGTNIHPSRIALMGGFQRAGTVKNKMLSKFPACQHFGLKRPRRENSLKTNLLSKMAHYSQVKWSHFYDTSQFWSGSRYSLYVRNYFYYSYWNEKSYF